MVLESKEERKEVAKMIGTLLAKKWRFWGISKSGDCFRIGGDMNWYKSPCRARGHPGGYTFNPFCKKHSTGTKEFPKEGKGKVIILLTLTLW